MIDGGMGDIVEDFFREEENVTRLEKYQERLRSLQNPSGSND